MLSLVRITAFRLESKLPPMRALEFIRDHVTFKLPYDFSYHMKNPKYFEFLIQSLKVYFSEIHFWNPLRTLTSPFLKILQKKIVTSLSKKNKNARLIFAFIATDYLTWYIIILCRYLSDEAGFWQLWHYGINSWCVYWFT